MNILTKPHAQRFCLAVGILIAAFGRPLFQLASFAAHDELYSYILLIPVISIYLIWTDKRPVEDAVARPCWPGAALAFLAGGAVLAAFWLGRRTGSTMAKQDYFALMALAFLFCFWGVCLAVLGKKLMGRYAFPAGFLLFLVPLPVSWQDAIVAWLQQTSAMTASGFFSMANEPVLRDSTDLRLPGFSLTVAPECSGIHSTMVLLITSILASHLFLRRLWTRTGLVLAVIPLAILRNGFRIFVVGELCVHVGPHMIDSPIHRKGGPLFFALSLIPFFFWLLFLRKRDVSLPALPQPELNAVK